MSKNQKHHTLKEFIDFIPAQVSNGKIVRIYYYAYNPTKQKLDRVVIKCNRLKLKRENLTLAKRICFELNEKLKDGWNPFLSVDCLDNDTTILDGVNLFIENKKSDARADTIRSYSSILDVFKKWIKKREIERCPISSFSKKYAEKYSYYLSNKEGMGNRTYNNNIKLLRTVFNFFISKDLIKENPFNKIQTKRTDEKFRDIIPPEVRTKIKDYFLQNNPPFFYMMQLCYRCLIRPKEILMLKIKYVNFVSGVLKIPSYVSKNHTERVIALHDDIVDFLKKYENLNKEWYIFSKDYKPGDMLLTTRDSGRTWANMRNELKLPKQYQFYSLKDTGITEMLENGAPTKLVKELAGHHSLEMTEKYVHRSNINKIKQYNNLTF